MVVRDPGALTHGDFGHHGHTGFAWAARRDALSAFGLYDACIVGSGDHFMAHAFSGDWESPCLDRIFGDNPAHRRHALAWCERMYPHVRARVRHVPGTLLHLWHGSRENRGYTVRNQELAAFGFDPSQDLRIGRGGCWEWSSDKPEMHDWLRRYFETRREDGPPPAV